MEAIKKTQTEGWLDMENLGKWTGTTETSITNRVQEIYKRISGTEDSIEEIKSLIKENSKFNKFLTQNIQEIWNTMKRPNLRIIGIERRRRRITPQRPRKYSQHYYRRKPSQHKEGYSYEDTRSVQHQIDWIKKKHPLTI